MRGGFQHPAVALLLAVAITFAVVHAGQPLHLHHGTTAGIYNEEHVLAALDSVSGDAPLPADASYVGLDLARTRAQLPAGARPDVPVASHADPRAPPLV